MDMASEGQVLKSNSGVAKLTQNKVQFGIGLEGIVKCDEKWIIPDGFENLSFGFGVFGGFLLLYNGGLLQHFHGVQTTVVAATTLSDEKNFAVRCKKIKKS